MKKSTDKKIAVLRLIGFALIAVILMTSTVFATTDAANFGKNAGEWLLAQIFWIALIVVVVVLIQMLLSRNFVRLLITAVVSAVALFVISNPQRLRDIGETIFNTVLSS
jgi:cell division protein FtsW (lipid II flippase)